VLITLEDWETIKRLAAEEAKAKGIVLREEREGGVMGTAAEPKPAVQNQMNGRLNETPPFDVSGSDDETIEDDDDLGEDSLDRTARENAEARAFDRQQSRDAQGL
jgi:hypothetical protein